METVLDRLLYTERLTEKPHLNAGLFGSWCTHTFPGNAVPPLSTIWQDIMTGTVPADVDGRLSHIGNLVAVFQTDKAMIDVPMYAADEDVSSVAVGADGRFSVTRQALVVLETYVFAILWPARFKVLLQEACVVDRAAPPSCVQYVKRWLLEVSTNMESSSMEYACRQLYCGALLPPAVALRASKSLYERYRDLDSIFPRDKFDEDIELLSIHPPRDILDRSLALPGSLIETVSALGIFIQFLVTTCNLPFKVRATSAADSGIAWCPPWAIYVVHDMMCFSPKENIYLRATNVYDLIYVFISHACIELPLSTRLSDIAKQFEEPAVDPARSEWAD